ncbi:protein prenylyltransferase [Aureobasidium namibiae CBS 147.97]|uniref:Geranylgeranyl transferase type-2 subunit alpha n=1 Tax=Aureobasidium namibiae CBS 147.97 TaxID=1043004 RepID=A0A074WDP5_9PEZI
MSHGVPRVAVSDKTDAARRKELKQIGAYQALIKAQEYTSETLGLTSALLTQNPEYYTVWNHRRLVLQHVFAKEVNSPPAEDAESKPAPGLNPAQHEITLLIREDLAFLLPLLKQFPKCYWVWNHRAWLLQQASKYLPVTSAKKLWQQEMALVTKMLTYDSRNFHGWSYRREVVKSIQDLSAQELQDKSQDEQQRESEPSMTESEFAYTTKMIKTNLSNFSAWHNRLQLIPKLLKERNADFAARKKLLDDEFELIITALYTDPYDQSLWFYHNYLMTNLSLKTSSDLRIVPNLTNQHRIEYYDTQLDLLKDMLEDTKDCKWIYLALVTYTPEYLEIDAGNKKVTTLELTEWLDQLEQLDPLRKGRWLDLRKSLNL